jgi:FkbM family methyltransferase
MADTKLKLMATLRHLGNQLSLGKSIRLPQSILRRMFRRVHGTVEINDFDGDIRLDLRLSDHMQRRIFWMGYYNLEIVPFMKGRLQEGMSVIDIGANIGEISLVAAKCVGKSGHVVAFEPVDAIADKLQSTVEQNNLRQISVVRMGLSDTISDSVPIYASCGQGSQRDEHGGLGSLYGAATGTAPLQNIAVTTLDDWLSNHCMDRIDLIKIDIEGAELPCLRGARQTLLAFNPMLIVEVQEPTATTAGYHSQDVLDFLAALGYGAHLIDRKGKVQPFYPTATGGIQNVLFLPPIK